MHGATKTNKRLTGHRTSSEETGVGSLWGSNEVPPQYGSRGKGEDGPHIAKGEPRDFVIGVRYGLGNSEVSKKVGL